jgi:hypothetical protein
VSLKSIKNICEKQPQKWPKTVKNHNNTLKIVSPVNNNKNNNNNNNNNKMPSCSGRNVLYVLMALQVISTLERQIFDFLGYMWLPIIGNFIHTLAVILGIFGVYQYTSKHMITYILWCIIWTGWNMFCVCFYLEIGSLQRTEDILSFGTGSYSWWFVNGLGCKPEYFPGNDTTLDLFIPSDVPPSNIYKPVKPTSVSGCLVDYQHVEVIHACIQILLAIFALMFGIPLTHYLIAVVEPKYRQTKAGKKLKKNVTRYPSGSNHGGAGNAMYSIEYSAQVNESSVSATAAQDTDFYSLETGQNNGNNGDVRPHMTPRRVKRRSYTRSSARSAGKALKKDLHRQSGRSIRSAAGAIGGIASATGRMTNNSKSINPVTRLIQVIKYFIRT